MGTRRNKSEVEGITEKELAFCNHYQLNDGKVECAVAAAGYKYTNLAHAKEIGNNLLTKLHIQNQLIISKKGIDVHKEYVLDKLKRVIDEFIPANGSPTSNDKLLVATLEYLEKYSKITNLYPIEKSINHNVHWEMDKEKIIEAYMQMKKERDY